MHRIPQQRGKGAHITAIEDMPLRQTPDVLGLHPSADVAYLTDATRALWRDLLSMQPRTAPSSSGLLPHDASGAHHTLHCPVALMTSCSIGPQCGTLRFCST